MPESQRRAPPLRGPTGFDTGTDFAGLNENRRFALRPDSITSVLFSLKFQKSHRVTFYPNLGLAGQEPLVQSDLCANENVWKDPDQNSLL